MWASLAAIISLGVGATAVFINLQNSLNTIWNVQRKAGHGLRYFLKDRLLSFAMVLGVGFVLLVSLLLNAVLASIGHVAAVSPTGHPLVWGALNFLISLAVITLLFALIYKLLPDVTIAWADVWVGAFVTALLFNLGKFLIGCYLGRSTMVSIYGAAGSFIVLLLWVYYSAQACFSARNLPAPTPNVTSSRCGQKTSSPPSASPRRKRRLNKISRQAAFRLTRGGAR